MSKLDAYIEDVQGTGLTKQDAKDYVMEEFRKGELTLVDKELDLVHLNSTRGTTIGNGSTISKNGRCTVHYRVSFTFFEILILSVYSLCDSMIVSDMFILRFQGVNTYRDSNTELFKIGTLL